MVKSYILLSYGILNGFELGPRFNWNTPVYLFIAALCLGLARIFARGNIRRKAGLCFRKRFRLSRTYYGT